MCLQCVYKHWERTREAGKIKLNNGIDFSWRSRKLAKLAKLEWHMWVFFSRFGGQKHHLSTLSLSITHKTGQDFFDSSTMHQSWWLSYANTSVLTDLSAALTHLISICHPNSELNYSNLHLRVNKSIRKHFFWHILYVGSLNQQAKTKGKIRY